MSYSRPIRLPAVDLGKKPLPVSAFEASEMFRVHSVRFPAISFRLNPNHRFSHPDAPGGLLYLGEDLETCLWECFGDEILDHSAIAKVDLGKRLSKVESTECLKLCDLTNLHIRRTLSLDLSALKHTDLSVPQAWGLAIQNHPEAVDGIRYLSRFTDRPCVALFERPGLTEKLRETPVSLLAELDAADDLLAANSIALI